MNYAYQQRVHMPAPRITWAVQRLLFVTIGVFALQLAIDPFIPLLQTFIGEPLGLELRGSGYLPGGLLNFWFGFQPNLVWVIWKPFTYMFLHAGLMHLFMNMLWLFIFGPDVERLLGSRTFIRFYIACGALGVLATIPAYVLGGGLPASVIGASGATMGVLVAFAMVDPDRQFFLFPLPFPLNARAIVLIVVVLNVIQGMGNTSVSVATHFGGMGAGYLLMKAIPRWNAYQTQRRKEAAKAKKDKVGEAVDNIFKFNDHKRD